MKKLVAGLLSVVLAGSMLGSNVLAKASEENVNEAYQKVKEFYADNYTLNKYGMKDEIIAMEALGLEAEDLYTYQLYDETTDFASMKEADLGKLIITLALSGQDPRNANGVDLVALLESYIHEDGTIYRDPYDNGANMLVWCLYALEVVESDQVPLVADALANMQVLEDHVEGPESDKGGFMGTYGVSVDTTAWCMEALTIANREKYSENVENAIEYLTVKQTETSAFRSYYFGMFEDPNTDTQACAIQGLSVYNKTGVQTGLYDKGDTSVFDVLLANQNEAGSFGYNDTNYNSYATMEAARSLGTYMNGSFVEKARAEYQETLNQKNEKPSVPGTDTPETDVPVEEGPATSDTSAKMSLMIMISLAAGVIAVSKKRYE